MAPGCSTISGMKRFLIGIVLVACVVALVIVGRIYRLQALSNAEIQRATNKDSYQYIRRVSDLPVSGVAVYIRADQTATWASVSQVIATLEAAKVPVRLVSK
jgi:hypothetical protein